MLAARIASTTSFKVMSGCFSMRASRKAECASNGEVLPPLGLAQMLPLFSSLPTHLIAELALTSNRSAASWHEAPSPTAATTRNRKSSE
jgi:hypothetical protein